MKKKFLLGLAFVAIVAGGCFLAGNNTSNHDLTPDQIANIDALSDVKPTITCNRAPCGVCYDRNDMDQCVFTGFQFHYCC